MFTIYDFLIVGLFFLVMSILVSIIWHGVAYCIFWIPGEQAGLCDPGSIPVVGESDFVETSSLTKIFDFYFINYDAKTDGAFRDFRRRKIDPMGKDGWALVCFETNKDKVTNFAFQKEIPEEFDLRKYAHNASEGEAK